MSVPDVLGLWTAVRFLGGWCAGGSHTLDDSAEIAVADRLPMLAE